MTLKQQIEHILKRKPQARNSDIALTICLWETYYTNLVMRGDRDKTFINLDSLYNLPSQDNIKRIRAKFNSEGLYLPTDKRVIKQRKLNEADWHENMSPSNPSKG